MFFQQKLEKLLPARPKVNIPEGEDVEEVNLMEVDTSHRSGGSGSGGAFYDEDDDDEQHGGPKVQCAHQ